MIINVVLVGVTPLSVMCLLFQGESSGAFKGFKGFALSTAAASGGSTPTAFSGFGNGGGFKGLSGLTNGNSIAPSFGGFPSPAATSTATPGEETTAGLQCKCPDYWMTDI